MEQEIPSTKHRFKEHAETQKHLPLVLKPLSFRTHLYSPVFLLENTTLKYVDYRLFPFVSFPKGGVSADSPERCVLQ